MKINKMTASFGKLNNDTIEFHDGLNVVTAPNESGKSTWCAFIRDMLYGVESSERAKAGFLPDKIKYAPWSGAPMQGTMEVNCGDKDITITRTTRVKSGPMREFSAVYNGTNVEVDGLDGQNAGEKLTGVSRDVFRRSAFVEQGGLAVSASPELERRIAAIVSTGEEDTSYSETDQRLRAWQRKRRFNRRGRLPELEDEMNAAKSRMEEMNGAALERERLQERQALTERLCANLEQQVAESRKQCRRDALDGLTKSRTELNRATDDLNAISTKARADRAALEHNLLGDTEPEIVKAQAQKDKARSKELLAKSREKGSVAAVVCFAIMALAALALGILVSPLGYIAAVIMAAGAVFAAVSMKKKNAAAQAADSERRELLKKYMAGDERDIDAVVEEHNALYALCMASEQEMREAALRLENARKSQEGLESSTLSNLDFSNGDTAAAQLGRELSAARRERDEIAASIAGINGRMQALGDPVVIKSSLENMQAEYDRLQREYDALALAVDTLSQADSEIQSRFSPELGALAAHYMSVMTDGKYTGLLINRDFTARTSAQGDSVPRQTEYLSAGTADLMYLALRLAVCALALPEGSSCPLILDDALVNFDPQREKQAMKLLEELSKKRQVILFTCK